MMGQSAMQAQGPHFMIPGVCVCVCTHVRARIGTGDAVSASFLEHCANLLIYGKN